MKYYEIEIEVISFEAQDIVTASGDTEIPNPVGGFAGKDDNIFG